MQSNFSSFVSFLFANVVIIFQNATLLAKKLVIFEKKFLLSDKRIIIRAYYLFVRLIIRVTATIAMLIPTIILIVNGSPNISVPTSIAVIGSNTPNTDAFVAPMLRVANASVAVDTMVGKMANPSRLNHDPAPSIPFIIVTSESNILTGKIIAPTHSVAKVNSVLEMSAILRFRLMMTINSE